MDLGSRRRTASGMMMQLMGKGPDKPGSQLAVLHLEGQVTGEEPDLLANLVGGSRCVMLVGGGSIAVNRLEESSACLVPGALAMVNEGLG